MKWQMRKIVLLALIVSTLFFQLVIVLCYISISLSKQGILPFKVLLVSVRKTYERTINGSYYSSGVIINYCIDCV